MKKILLAVDETYGSERAVEKFIGYLPRMRPDEVVIAHVERIGGISVMDDMITDTELSTLKETLRESEFQEKLDRRAGYLTGHFRRLLEEAGVIAVKEIIREGHPAEEILRAARQEEADIIVIGSRGKDLHTLTMGSVSRQVADGADRPVLILR